MSDLSPRLKILDESGLLDSPPEEAFDRWTRMAGRCLGLTAALVVLAGEERTAEGGRPPSRSPLESGTHTRTFVKSRHGATALPSDAFVLEAVLTGQERQVDGWVGIPLAEVGAFCALSSDWTEEKLAGLRDLAGAAATEIELRLSRAETAALQRSLKYANVAAQAMNQRLRTQNLSLQKARRELESLSRTDPLTQLANRRSATENLEHQWGEFVRYRRQFSCILVDVDHFKSVNDTFGHEAGDRVLIAVAQALARCVRNTDVVCRYGGEEFLVLCPETPCSGAVVLAERLRAEVASLQVLERRVTASFGVAEAAAGQGNPDGLLRAADAALYLAKDGGRNRVLTAA